MALISYEKNTDLSCLPEEEDGNHFHDGHFAILLKAHQGSRAAQSYKR